jgi:hypothetical protein
MLENFSEHFFGAGAELVGSVGVFSAIIGGNKRFQHGLACADNIITRQIQHDSFL